ncbi:hypothetical protein [Photobacterium lutimaris]|uniref:Uncharacterized protein n=1 Tax=Photobacterium lutimaris TaxID=388278 RepID=A0A2T3ITK9_9GAMM|nr:hypothetical protein [Photobacterium lutimaris]PSU31697.1 hypothetical protein C9I99_21150 [Photobacterium lutimaris]TDR72666.1 hypothetical protein DFP78_113142 [Photobacterium lutimaris]
MNNESLVASLKEYMAELKRREAIYESKLRQPEKPEFDQGRAAGYLMTTRASIIDMKELFAQHNISLDD